MDRLSLSEYIQKIIFPAFGITMEVLFFTVIISTIIGFIIAIILDITRSDGMYPNKIFFNIMDTIINLIRSFPFVILMVSLIPLTRFITGSSIGVKAARSFGASPAQIIWHITLVEAVPGICSVICFATIAALNATTIAGMVGAGGLGNVAIRYGYQNFNDKIMYSTVAILIVLVQIIQFIGNRIYNKLK